MEDGRSQPSSLLSPRTSHRLRVARIERPFQSIPIKMKSPTSIRKVTLMMASVRNTSSAEHNLSRIRRRGALKTIARWARA